MSLLDLVRNNWNKFAAPALAAVALTASAATGNTYSAPQQQAVPAVVEPAKPASKDVAILEKTDDISRRDYATDITLNERDMRDLASKMINQPRDALNYLTNKWADSHRNHPSSLRKAVEKASMPVCGAENLIQNYSKCKIPIIAYVKGAFKREGVDPNYAHLGIAETYWGSSRNVSRAGARGVFQFMKKTAQNPAYGRHLGLLVRSDYDERDNAILSGIAAAVNFRYLQLNLKEIALFGYNSSAPWRYKVSNSNPTPEGYVKHLGFQLKQVVDSIDSRTRKSRNDNSSLYLTKNNRTARFKKENLNYPPKFDGINLVLQEKHPDFYKIQPETNALTVLTYTKESQADSYHTVVRRENLSRIANKHGISLNELLDANSNVNPRRVRAGQQIVIPKRNSELSPYDLAKELGVEEDIFFALNKQMKGRNSVPSGAHIILPNANVENAYKAASANGKYALKKFYEL